MWTYTGKRIKEGRAWTDNNGIQHPTNWASWSDVEKRARGLVWVDPPFIGQLIIQKQLMM